MGDQGIARRRVRGGRGFRKRSHGENKVQPASAAPSRSNRMDPRLFNYFYGPSSHYSGDTDSGGSHLTLGDVQGRHQSHWTPSIQPFFEDEVPDHSRMDSPLPRPTSPCRIGGGAGAVSAPHLRGHHPRFRCAPAPPGVIAQAIIWFIGATYSVSKAYIRSVCKKFVARSPSSDDRQAASRTWIQHALATTK